MKKILLIILLLSSMLYGVERRLIVYYAKWSVDHPHYPLEISHIPTDLVSDFVYAFVDVDEEGNIKVNEEEKQQLTALVNWKQAAKAQGIDIRTIFSIGGWGEGSEPLSSMTADASSRDNFARQALTFCQNYQFDGVDIDWEFPKDLEEGENFYQLIFTLNRELKQNVDIRYLITIAAPALPEDYRKIDWSRIGPLVDRISVMTYDMHGPWKDPENLVTNHQAALKATIVGSADLNTTAVLKYYSAHVPNEKLAVGIPLFFTAYADVREGIKPSHYASIYSGAAKNPYVSYEEGELYYRDIVDDVKTGKAQEFWDPTSVAYTAYYPKTAVFASGMNPEAIRQACRFIIEKGYQGAKIWNFQGDTPDWQALRLMHDLLLK